MGVTVAANGLSVVHQGSGGEANATLPDVCLTKVGKPIVPIPYGNNAKSADLAKGTTTITMDGGNPVAIKGSTFSKSTGDAGGDKKGVASGTIEAEAEFISASPTVKFEGKGVCRLSDQMTMNKANTMCLGGAQNPSVSVTAEEEGTYTVDIHVTYDDGEGFQAPFKLTDIQNNVFDGQLDTQGKASVSGIAPGLFHLEYGEDQRTYSPTASFTNKNPHFKDLFDPNVLIDEAKIGRIGFWEAGRNTVTTSENWIWGVMIGDLNQNPTSGQLMLSTILSVIPGVDQVMDARDITVNIFYLTDKENQKNPEYWFGLTLAAIGAIPTIGSVMKGMGKAIQSEKSRDDVFALLREMGKGNVETFINEINWQFIQQQVLQIVSEVIDSFSKVLATLADYANKFGYRAYAIEIIQFSSQIQDVEKLAHDQLPSAIGYFQQLLETSMKKGRSSPTKGSRDKRGTSQSGKHDDTVHQDKKNKKPDECWLCEQKVAQKKQEKTGSDYCKKKGFKGEYYKKTDADFGFTSRGLNRETKIKGVVYPPNGHYPWDLLKKHGYLSSASPMKHELYLRCYDVDDNGNYIRPHHVWTTAEFKQQQELGIIEKGKKHWPGTILAAHHIITCDELKENTFLYKKLPYLGYDVNARHNIVVLPTIPELACFYEMPLHPGAHPSDYTSYISQRLEELQLSIRDSDFCNLSAKEAAKQICDKMEAISRQTLKLINSFHINGALNAEHHDIYKKGNKGCCNQRLHSEIAANYTTLSGCSHRIAAQSDNNKHHIFKTTQQGQPKTVIYCGTVIPALETK